MAEHAILHIIDRSIIDSSRFNRLLDRSGTENALLFIQDSVYALKTGSVAAKTLSRCVTTHTVYALEPDLQARGISGDGIISGVKLIDYSGFVDLTVAYSKINRWL